MPSLRLGSGVHLDHDRQQARQIGTVMFSYCPSLKGLWDPRCRLRLLHAWDPGHVHGLVGLQWRLRSMCLSGMLPGRHRHLPERLA